MDTRVDCANRPSLCEETADPNCDELASSDQVAYGESDWLAGRDRIRTRVCGGIAPAASAVLTILYRSVRGDWSGNVRDDIRGPGRRNVQRLWEHDEIGYLWKRFV